MRRGRTCTFACAASACAAANRLSTQNTSFAFDLVLRTKLRRQQPTYRIIIASDIFHFCLSADCTYTAQTQRTDIDDESLICMQHKFGWAEINSNVWLAAENVAVPLSSSRTA